MTSIGDLGEQLAVNYLKKQGYKILARNFKTRVGELDIVAQKGRLLIVVEVKTLNSKLSPDNLNFFPETHFHQAKKQRLKRTIELFLLSEKLPAEKQPIRVDLIALELNQGSLTQLRHYQNLSLD